MYYSPDVLTTQQGNPALEPIHNSFPYTRGTFLYGRALMGGMGALAQQIMEAQERTRLKHQKGMGIHEAAFRQLLETGNPFDIFVDNTPLERTTFPFVTGLEKQEILNNLPINTNVGELYAPPVSPWSRLLRGGMMPSEYEVRPLPTIPSATNYFPSGSIPIDSIDVRLGRQNMSTINPGIMRVRDYRSIPALHKKDSDLYVLR